MKKNQGFTLIELLVVIAIIGILASVVLASLNSARTKAADAKVQSQMANLRAAAETAYNGSSYGNATGANNCSGLTGNTLLSTFIATSSWPDGVAPVCTSNATGATAITGYAFWHAQTTGGWCVDSTGASISLASAPAAGKNCAGGNL